jgi:hypothetical protein
MVIPPVFPWDRYGRDKVHNALANKPFRRFINTNRLTAQFGNHVAASHLVMPGFDPGMTTEMFSAFVPSWHEGGRQE